MKEFDDPTLRVYAPKPKRGGPHPESAGQSGDDMTLPRVEDGSESVAELIDEGQYFEAEALSGLERPYPDEGEVRTHEVPEDDVPFEYPPKDSVDTD